MALAVNEDERSINEIYLPDVKSCWKHYFTGEVTRGGTFIENLPTALEEVHFWEKIDC